MRFVLLCFVSLLAVRTLAAQQFEVGAFAALGVESAPQSSSSASPGVALVGIHGDWLRPIVHPGLEVRGVSAGGDSTGVSGTLTGPRISMNLGGYQPYAAALFGPNHVDVAAAGVLAPGAPLTHRHDGVTVQGTIGLDIDCSAHVRIRAFEVSWLQFNGLPNSHPIAGSFGIVIHSR